MYKYLMIALLFSFVACKNAPTNNGANKEEVVAKTRTLPAYVSKVMDAHGGMELWNSMRSMSYVIDKEKGDEKQSIDLWDRRELVERTDYKMVYDGSNYWTTADTSVNANPVFYKNLIFYFYGMPFVVADEGVNYEEVPALVFEDVSYPGFRISFDNGVGISSQDEYFIHYDPKTYQMAWLGYTVTYFSKEKSKSIGWRKYDDWTDVSGLKLPKTMARMEGVENLPVKEKSRSVFKDLMVSKDAFDDQLFAVPTNGRVVTE